MIFFDVSFLVDLTTPKKDVTTQNKVHKIVLSFCFSYECQYVPVNQTLQLLLLLKFFMLPDTLTADQSTFKGKIIERIYI